MRGDMGVRKDEISDWLPCTNQVARAIVRMDDRLSKKNYAMRSTHNTFMIEVLGTPVLV